MRKEKLFSCNVSHYEIHLSVHIITRKRILEFGEKYSDSVEPLERWYRILKHNNFNSFSELRKTFPQADRVGRFIIFNIGGNKYRLISFVNFQTKRVFIRHILTHSEYDKINWKEK